MLSSQRTAGSSVLLGCQYAASTSSTRSNGGSSIASGAPRTARRAIRSGMIATISVPASTNGTDSQPKTVTRTRGATPSSSSTRSTGVREPGANVGAACGILDRSSKVSRPSRSHGFAASTTQTNRSRNSSACLPGKS